MKQQSVERPSLRGGQSEPSTDRVHGDQEVSEGLQTSGEDQCGYRQNDPPLDTTPAEMSLSVLDRMASGNWREVWNPRMSMSLTSTKGLLNPAGQNNCFLNSAVQVLWHLDVFRRSFRQFSGHACMGNSCIFCALKVIFTQFQYSDQSCLPPDSLRKALAKSFANQHRFQVGHMDDAAECFENILTRIHFHIANTENEDHCNARHCIPHQKFSLHVFEQMVCSCGARSEQQPFKQMVHYVSANSLVSQAQRLEAQGSDPTPRDLFAQMIRTANNEGEMRSCPKNCGKKVQVLRTLLNCPDVVSIGLIWDSDRPNLEHIKDVVRCIGTSIRLPDLYHSVQDDRWAQSPPLQLVGVVCYYGKHYSTFFFHTKMNKWVYFDDATVKEMGSHWQVVADKCCRGHYQPLLLLYSNQNSTPVDISTAPQTTTKLPGYQNYSFSDDSVGESPSPPKNNNKKFVNHQNMRRSQTPNPELSGHSSGMNTPQRRAITPGPEWGHPGHYNSNEDLTGARDTNAHYRQPSYLTAMDTVDYGQHSYPPSSGGYDSNPYGTVAPSRSGYSASSISGGSSYNGSQTLPARSSAYYPVQSQSMPQYTTSTTSTSQYYSSAQSQNQPLHNSRQYPGQAQYPQSQYPSQQHSQNRQQDMQSQRYNSQSISGQSRDIPTSYQGSMKPNVPSRSQQGNTISAKDIPKQVSDEWTLSTSEQYRRTTPVSPTKEKSRFVYPNSHQRSSQPTMAKGSEVSRIDSFTKKGADNVKHQKNIHDEYPLEHYQRNRSNSQDGILGGNAPYGEVSKSQDSSFQNAMKRAKSLENTAAAAEQAAVTVRSGASVIRGRPASARPYDYGHQKPVVQQHAQPQRSASTQPDKQPTIVYPDPEYVTHDEIMKQTTGYRVHRGLDSVDGTSKTAKSSLHAQPTKGSSSQTEDNYATINMRKQVENILHLQNKRVRPKTSTGLPSSSASSHTNNTSLETLSTGFKDTLQVDIPGDNISIGSNMSKSDSGYRSGDRNSASSASSGVDSPLPEASRHYGKTAFIYGSYDPKATVHSSNDSLDSAQSGQSCATLTNKSTSGQHLGHIPENVATGYGKRPDSSITPAYVAQQDKECENLCMRAEDLMKRSASREKYGDFAGALVHCDHAIGQLQLAENMPHISGKMKNHAHTKQTQCVLKARGLHKHMNACTSRQDSAFGSDVSEDHISLSSMSTEAENDLIQMNVALGDAKHQRMKENIKQIYHDDNQLFPEKQPPNYVNQHNYVNQPIYGSQYGSQYSSDSGYSTTTDEQKPRKKKMPHPAPETTLLEASKKELDIYATLPRKSTQKAALRNQSKDYELYQSYAHKTDMQLKPRHRSDSESSIANLSTAGNHSRQSSGASLRMSKEEINQHLSDFVRTKQSNKKQAAAEKQFNKLLYEDMINMQRRQLNFKDGKQPLPVQPPTIPDSKLPPQHKPSANQNQHRQDTYGPPVYVDHRQLHDMSNQSLLSYAQSLPQGAGSHSRESSASSSHTLKAHSRDNSLTSHSNNPQGVYGAYRPPHQQMPPSGQQMHPNITDRRMHNTSSDDMRPFPGAVPLTDPGGSNSTDAQLRGGTVAQRIAALGKQKEPAGSVQTAQSTGHLATNNAENPLRHEVGFNKSSGKGTFGPPENVSYSRSHSVDSAISTNPSAVQAPLVPGAKPAGGPPPPPPPKPGKDHRDHLLTYATVGKKGQVKVPPPTMEKPKISKKPRPSVPKRTVSLNNVSSLDADSSMSVEGEDEDFPPPPPDSELLANQPHLMPTESSQYVPSFYTYPTNVPSSPQGSCCTPPNFAPADFPDADTSSVSSQQFTIPLMVEKPKPKPVLKKKSTKKSRKGMKKSVTFSDSISLIAEKENVEEPPQEVDYMAYVQNLLAHKKKGSLTKASSNPDLSRPKYEDPKEAMALRNGYDSDFDEDTSDSENSVENSNGSSHVRCNLCRKRVIDVNDMYCTDCQFYMSQFQPQT